MSVIGETLTIPQMFNPGDTMTVRDETYAEMSVPCLISSSTTTVYGSLVLPKSLAKISTVRFSSFRAEIRGENGYLNSESGTIEYVGRSGYTITVNKATDNMITFALAKSSAWGNTSNNSPVSVYFKGGTTLQFS